MSNSRKWVCRWDSAADKMIMIPVGEASPEPRLHVIQDSMDAVAHPVTGRLMDSKSAFREVTKAAGCVEMGNDAPVQPKQWSEPTNVKQDLIRAFQELEQRR